MELQELVKKPGIGQDKKLSAASAVFEKLISELKKRTLPPEIVHSINLDLEALNSFSGSNKDLLKKMKKTQAGILKLLEKDLKLVVKNHYRNMWLALGMSAFGIPFGVALGISLGNLGLLGIGLPIGMAIGVGVGTAMDKKAQESGNQLDLEI